MYDQEEFIYLLAAALTLLAIQLWIFYLLVRSAVSSAIKPSNDWQEYYLKMQTRLMIANLVKNGTSVKDIKGMMDADDTQFWRKLQEAYNLSDGD